ALLLAVSGALLMQMTRLRGGLDVALQEHASLDTRVRTLQQQLDEQRTANTTMSRELERAREGATQPPMVAMVLMPQLRALGPLPTIAVAPGTDHVAFVLRLESNDFTRYQVALKDPATNQIVWRSDPISPAPQGGAAAVAVDVPARILK